MKPINHHKNRFLFLEGQDPTSCGLIIMIHSPNPSKNSARIVINLFFDPKMRSPLEISHIEVTFSVQGDSVWSTLPPGTSSVGFEPKIVEDVLSYMLSEPQSVIESIFGILYFKKKRACGSTSSRGCG